MRKTVVYSVAFAVVVFGAAAAVAQTDSGCVRCHADEARMKSLFVAPKIDGGEGEG
ncbi:MAG: hypothetical protein IH628_03755 [Proteobacteria bacterium]|nr:hypothetical protein [Pseudomonadota bacterium]